MVQVPKLPGYIQPVQRDGPFYKPQTLKYLKAGFATETPLPIAEPPQEHTAEQASYSDWPVRCQAQPLQQLPKWLAHDGQVLRFFAWFRQDVPDNPLESWRVRKVVILYYLVDNTAQVYEPSEHNSGLLQGPLLKRHRVPYNNGTLSPSDFHIGTPLVLYNTTYHMVDADTFTRTFYENAGAPLPGPLPVPSQPLEEHHAKLQQRAQVAHSVVIPGEMSMTQYCEAMLGKPVVDRKLKQFIENNKQVLCFHCRWSDPLLPPAQSAKRNSPYDMSTGDVRHFRLHYFLEDDTVEVLECHEPNNGRDPFPALLRRSPLPKAGMASPLTQGLPPDAFVRPGDIRLGSTVRVYGRDLVVYDCDEHTRAWLQEHLGYTPVELQHVPAPIITPRVIPPSPPPHMGFGSDADSMQNCLSLQPKPPKKNIAKLLEKDKQVLRFAARIVQSSGRSVAPADAPRRFVISYFLADDTVSVFEPPIRNSGIIGGRFYERSAVKGVTDQQLFVGGHLCILQRVFELIDADEYSLKYMEADPKRYSVADVPTATQALQAAVQGAPQQLRQALCTSAHDASGTLTLSQLLQVLATIPGTLAHHGLTWFRAHQREGRVGVDTVLELLNNTA